MSIVVSGQQSVNEINIEKHRNTMLYICCGVFQCIYIYNYILDFPVSIHVGICGHSPKAYLHGSRGIAVLYSSALLGRLTIINHLEMFFYGQSKS